MVSLVQFVKMDTILCISEIRGMGLIIIAHHNQIKKTTHSVLQMESILTMGNMIGVQMRVCSAPRMVSLVQFAKMDTILCISEIRGVAGLIIIAHHNQLVS